MEFRTTFDIPAEKGLVNYTNGPVILLGSCFADGVGQRLMERMFPVTVNPFGPLYNPASIAMIIETALSGKTITEDDLFHHEGLYRSFLCHTLLCSTSADETCRRLNAALLRLRNDLAKARLLIITLGTSKIYRRQADEMVVANCHKLPASQFTSSMLSEAEITGCLENIIDMVSGLNPGIRLMFTVSPVRHKADGLHVNNLSKARLLLAVDRAIELHGNRALYFPAYELVMDDLRNHFRPEFLNRLDETILFKPLTRDNIGGIIQLIIKDLNRRLADRELQIELTPEAERFIVENAYDPVYGARPLKRYIQKYVETLSAKLILADQVKAKDIIQIVLRADQLAAVCKEQ